MEPRSRQKAVDALREAADEYTYAGVGFGPPGEQPRARAIAALFELAGWRQGFNDLAQDTVMGYPYREGIEVIGLNSQLVEAVAEALSGAGMPAVRQVVRLNLIKPTNPKYPHVIKQIKVHVGHIPVGAKGRDARVREGVWTKVNVAVAVIVPTGLYLLGAAAQRWWPF